MKDRTGSGNPFHGRKHTAEWKAALSARQYKWTPEELDFIRRWYADRAGKKLDLARLGELLHRNRQVLSRKAQEMGLTKQSRPTGQKQRVPKYATEAERRAATGQRMKAWIAENGHPRGARGLQHTPGTLAKMQEGAKRWYETATPEQRSARTDKMIAGRIARYGTAGPQLRGEKAFSRAKSGRRADLNDRYFRSMWEANYARYLNLLRDRGLIAGWDYESRTFRFEGITRGCMTYTPDFEVTSPDGSVEYHEVKGWMDPKSRTRLDRMARYYPEVPLLLIDQKVYYEIAAKLGGAIPGWESAPRSHARSRGAG